MRYLSEPLSTVAAVSLDAQHEKKRFCRREKVDKGRTIMAFLDAPEVLSNAPRSRKWIAHRNSKKKKPKYTPALGHCRGLRTLIIALSLKEGKEKRTSGEER